MIQFRQHRDQIRLERDHLAAELHAAPQHHPHQIAQSRLVAEAPQEDLAGRDFGNPANRAHRGQPRDFCN